MNAAEQNIKVHMEPWEIINIIMDDWEWWELRLKIKCWCWLIRHYDVFRDDEHQAHSATLEWLYYELANV